MQFSSTTYLQTRGKFEKNWYMDKRPENIGETEKQLAF